MAVVSQNEDGKESEIPSSAESGLHGVTVSNKAGKAFQTFM
jgi:hypothetical protein